MDGSRADLSGETEHDQWNQLLELCANSAIGLVLQGCLEDRDVGKVAWSCHFALDVLSM